MFGLIAIYNLLPQYVIDSKTVKTFQGKLQEIVKYLAAMGYEEWRKCFNRSTLNRSVLLCISKDIVATHSELLPIARLSSVQSLYIINRERPFHL